MSDHIKLKSSCSKGAEEAGWEGISANSSSDKGYFPKYRSNASSSTPNSPVASTVVDAWKQPVSALEDQDMYTQDTQRHLQQHGRTRKHAELRPTDNAMSRTISLLRGHKTENRGHRPQCSGCQRQGGGGS